MEDRGENLSAGSLSSSQFDSKIWHEVDGMGGPESYEVNINYPPLFNEADFGGDGRPVSGDRAALGMVDFLGMTISKKSLFFAEWYLTNTGGIFFVIASFLFDRRYDRPTHRWAAILFIFGSTSLLIPLFAVIIPPD